MLGTQVLIPGTQALLLGIPVLPLGILVLLLAILVLLLAILVLLLAPTIPSRSRLTQSLVNTPFRLSTLHQDQIPLDAAPSATASPVVKHHGMDVRGTLGTSMLQWVAVKLGLQVNALELLVRLKHSRPVLLIWTVLHALTRQVACSCFKLALVSTRLVLPAWRILQLVLTILPNAR